MLFKNCDVCNKKILNTHSGLCSHCYYAEELAKCDDCGAELSISKYISQMGKCFSCYAIKELYECDTCGREISYSDYVYYEGECEYCCGECDEFSIKL